MDDLALKYNEIECHKFYYLDDYGWRIDCGTKISIEYNNQTLNDIAGDFESISGLPYNRIRKIFGKYICGRSSDSMLLIYANLASNQVYYILTNSISHVYKILHRKS